MAETIDLKSMSAEELISRLKAGDTDVLSQVPSEVLDTMAKSAGKQKTAASRAEAEKKAAEVKKQMEARLPAINAAVAQLPDGAKTFLVSAIENGFKVSFVSTEGKLALRVSDKPTRAGSGTRAAPRDLITVFKDYATNEEVTRYTTVQAKQESKEITYKQANSQLYQIKMAVQKRVDAEKATKRSTPASIGK